MDQFTDDQKRYIVMRLACFASPSQVARELLQEWQITASLARIMFYDPTSAQGKARLSEELKTLFAETRADYKTRVEDIPLATQVGRMARLQEQLDNCERNPVLAAAIIKQGAMEMGGMFTNRREITGANGKPIVPDAGARNEAGKELDAWRKVMNDQLSQSMNAPGIVGRPALTRDVDPAARIELETPEDAEAQRQAIEFAKCAADPAYFCHYYLVIDDAQGHGEGDGTMPFHLWPAQMRAMWLILTHRLLIILKARQLGISWLCCAYALWLCVFHPGKMVLCFSQGQMEANELLRRIQVLYDRLPDWLQDGLPKLVKDNTGSLEWDNGSRIRSLPATQKAGRSLTASLVILDEAAFLQWASQLYTALKPTIDGGGQLIILSTANGLGNLFHQLWTRANKQLNAFKTIFLPWWSRPERSRAWYNAQLGEYTDPQMVKQEYPSSAIEAFVASGRSRFASAWIEHQTQFAQDALPERDLPDALRALPGLMVYALPVPGRRYMLAADVAEGLAWGDYSAGVVVDRETWEELACIHGHWEPDVFGEHLATLGTAYNLADIAVERNNHGHTVLASLKRLAYARVVLGADDRPGWLTNQKTKPLVIDLLATALRDHLCRVRTPMALDEMQIYKILDDGSTGAPAGYNDDLVMAWAICLYVMRNPPIPDKPTYKPAYTVIKAKH